MATGPKGREAPSRREFPRLNGRTRLNGEPLADLKLVNSIEAQ
jgi:hypothetical protein